MTLLAANTTVILLAAGHGKRMLPLTKNTPKPLLKIGELSLIEHQLVKLESQGFRNIVINLAYLGEQIRNQLDDGNQFGLDIIYSDESSTGALETAGGIIKALEFVQSDPFIVINADIWTDYPFAKLLEHTKKYAHLIMVQNPSHNQDGDFTFSANKIALQETTQVSDNYTFSGIALYRKSIFESLPPISAALAPLFHQLIKLGLLSGELYYGEWHDIGTPNRLVEINAQHSEL